MMQAVRQVQAALKFSEGQRTGCCLGLCSRCVCIFWEASMHIGPHALLVQLSKMSSWGENEIVLEPK